MSNGSNKGEIKPEVVSGENIAEREDRLSQLSNLQPPDDKKKPVNVSGDGDLQPVDISGLLRSFEVGRSVQPTDFSMGVRLDRGYTRLLGDNINIYDPSLNVRRAEAQSAWAKIGYSIPKLFLNTGLGMTEAVGQTFEMISPDNNFSNILTEIARKGKENVDVALPTYRKDESKVFDFGDLSWWTDSISQLFESVAVFYTLGRFGGGITTLAAKGLARTAAASRAIRATGITATAFGLAGVEGGIEANEVYRSSFDIARSKGLTPQEAKDIASRAASNTFRFNTLIVGGLNISGIGPIFQKLHGARSLANTGLMARYGENLPTYYNRIKNLPAFKENMGRVYARYGVEAGQESLEEVINHIISEEGHYIGRRDSGDLSEDEANMSFGERLFQSVASERALFSGIMGFLGGALQYGLINHIPHIPYGRKFDENGKLIEKGEKLSPAQYTERLLAEQLNTTRKLIIDRIDEHKHSIDELKKAKDSGDVGKIKDAQSKIFANSTYDGIIRGIDAQLILMYKDILNLNDDQAGLMGFETDPDNDDYYKKLANEKIQDIKDLSQAYDDIYAKFNFTDEEIYRNVPDYIFKLHLNRHLANKDLSRYNSELDRIRSENDADALALGIDFDSTQFSLLTSEVDSTKELLQEIEDFENYIENNWDVSLDERNKIRNKLGLHKTASKNQALRFNTIRKIDATSKIRTLRDEKDNLVDSYINSKLEQGIDRKTALNQLELAFHSNNTRVSANALISRLINAKRGEIKAFDDVLSGLSSFSGRKELLETVKRSADNIEKGVQNSIKNIIDNIYDKFDLEIFEVMIPDEGVLTPELKKLIDSKRNRLGIRESKLKQEEEPAEATTSQTTTQLGVPSDADIDTPSSVISDVDIEPVLETDPEIDIAEQPKVSPEFLKEIEASEGERADISRDIASLLEHINSIDSIEILDFLSKEGFTEEELSNPIIKKALEDKRSELVSIAEGKEEFAKQAAISSEEAKEDSESEYSNFETKDTPFNEKDSPFADPSGKNIEVDHRTNDVVGFDAANSVARRSIDFEDDEEGRRINVGTRLRPFTDSNRELQEGTNIEFVIDIDNIERFGEELDVIPILIKSDIQGRKVDIGNVRSVNSILKNNRHQISALRELRRVIIDAHGRNETLIAKIDRRGYGHLKLIKGDRDLASLLLPDESLNMFVVRGGLFTFGGKPVSDDVYLNFVNLSNKKYDGRSGFMIPSAHEGVYIPVPISLGTIGPELAESVYNVIKFFTVNKSSDDLDTFFRDEKLTVFNKRKQRNTLKKFLAEFLYVSKPFEASQLTDPNTQFGTVRIHVDSKSGNVILSSHGSAQAFTTIQGLGKSLIADENREAVLKLLSNLRVNINSLYINYLNKEYVLPIVGKDGSVRAKTWKNYNEFIKSYTYTNVDGRDTLEHILPDGSKDIEYLYTLNSHIRFDLNPLIGINLQGGVVTVETKEVTSSVRENEISISDNDPLSEVFDRPTVVEEEEVLGEVASESEKDIISEPEEDEFYVSKENRRNEGIVYDDPDTHKGSDIDSLFSYLMEVPNEDEEYEFHISDKLKVELYGIEGFTPEQQASVVAGLTYAFSLEWNRQIEQGRVKANGRLMLDGVRSRVMDKYSELKDKKDPLVDEYIKILKNWSHFERLIIESLPSFGIITKNVDVDEITNLEIDDINFEKIRFDENGRFMIDPKLGTSARFRVFLSFIPRVIKKNINRSSVMTPVNEKTPYLDLNGNLHKSDDPGRFIRIETDGNDRIYHIPEHMSLYNARRVIGEHSNNFPVIGETIIRYIDEGNLVREMINNYIGIETNYLGWPIYVPFDTVYDQLNAVFADIYPNTIANMLGELKAIGKSNPLYAELYNRLLNSDFRIKAEFVNLMDKHAHVYQLVRAAKDRRTGSRLIYPVRSDSQDILSTIIASWVENQKMSRLTITDGKGNSLIDVDYVKELVDEYTKVYERSGIEKYKSEEMKNAFKSLLHNLGMTVSDQTVEDIFEKPKLLSRAILKSQLDPNDKNRFVGAIIHGFVSGFKDEDIDAFGKFSINNPLFGRQTDFYVKRLAKIESKYVNKLYTNSLSNIEGNTIWNYQHHTWLTHTIRKMLAYDVDNRDNPNNTYFDQLSKLAFSKDSPYIKHLIRFGPEELGIELFDIDGVSSDNSSRRAKWGSMSFIDKEIASIVLFQHSFSKSNGKYVQFPIPVHADKQAAYSIKVADITTLYDNTDYGFQFDENGRLSDLLVKGSAMLSIKDSMLSEYNRILTFQSTYQEVLDESGEYTAYANGASTFYIFPYLNSNVTPEIWNEDGSLKNDIDSMNLAINVVKKEYIDRINKTIQRWKDNDMINYFYSGYSTHLVSNTAATNYSGYAAAHYIISSSLFNVEYYRIMGADPAQFYKRGKGQPGSINSDILATIDNMNKRLGSLLSPWRTRYQDPNDRDTVVRAVIEDNLVTSVYAKEYLDSFGVDYTNIVSSDAQELVTLEEFVREMKANGLISPKLYKSLMEKATRYKGKVYAIEGKSIKLTTEEEDLVKSAMKPIHFVAFPIPEYGFMNLHLTKSSVIPLIPHLTFGHDIDKIRVYMEKNGIDRISYLSAEKIGVKKVGKIWRNDGSGRILDNFDLTDSLITMPREGLGLQQQTPVKEYTVLTVSQMNKNLLQGIRDYTFRFENADISGSDLEIIKEGIRSTLMKRAHDKLLENMGLERLSHNDEESFHFIVKDINKVRNYLYREAKNSRTKWSRTDLQALELIEEGDELQFNIPLSLTPAMSDASEKLLLSIIRNKITKIRLFGKGWTQASSSGFIRAEGFPMDQEGIIYIEDYDPSRGLTGMSLADGKFKPADILVPWYFENKKGDTIPIIDYIKTLPDGRRVIDYEKFDPELLKVIAARIPNAGHNAMLAMRIVGFLPRDLYSTAVVPAEVVRQMGSDMDFDKLNTYLTQYTSDKETRRKGSKDTRPYHGNLIKVSVDSVEGYYDMTEKEKLESLSTLQLKQRYVDLVTSVLSSTNIDIARKILNPLDMPDLKNEAYSINRNIPNLLDYNYHLREHTIQLAATDNVRGTFANAVTANSLLEKGSITINYSLYQKITGDAFPLKFVSDSGKKIFLTHMSIPGESDFSEIRTKADALAMNLSAAVDNPKEGVLPLVGYSPFTSQSIVLLHLATDKDGNALSVEHVSRFIRQESIQIFTEEYQKQLSILSTKKFTTLSVEKLALQNTIEILNKRASLPKEGDETQKVLSESGTPFDLSPSNLYKLLDTKDHKKGVAYWEKQKFILKEFMKIRWLARSFHDSRRTFFYADRNGPGYSLFTNALMASKYIKFMNKGNPNFRRMNNLLLNPDDYNKYSEYHTSSILALIGAYPLMRNIMTYDYNSFTLSLESIIEQFRKVEEVEEHMDDALIKHIWKSYKAYIYSHPKMKWSIADVSDKRRKLLFGGEKIERMDVKPQLIISNIKDVLEVGSTLGIETVKYIPEEFKRDQIQAIVLLEDPESESFEKKSDAINKIGMSWNKEVIINPTPEKLAGLLYNDKVKGIFVTGTSGYSDIISGAFSGPIDAIVKEESLAVRLKKATSIHSWAANNFFLSRLKSDISTDINTPSTISFANSKGYRFDDDDSLNGMYKLMLSKDKEQRELFRDLVEYAILTGAYTTPHSFVRYIPLDYLESIGFSKTLREADLNGPYTTDQENDNGLYLGINHQNFIDQYVRHNYDMVPSIKRMKGVTVSKDLNTLKINLDLDNPDTTLVDFFGYYQRSYPLYIRYAIPKAPSTNYPLYRLSSYSPDEGYIYQRLSTLGYSNRGHLISEYKPGNEYPFSIFPSNQIEKDPLNRFVPAALKIADKTTLEAKDGRVVTISLLKTPIIPEVNQGIDPNDDTKYGEDESETNNNESQTPNNQTVIPKGVDVSVESTSTAVTVSSSIIPDETLSLINETEEDALNNTYDYNMLVNMLINIGDPTIKVLAEPFIDITRAALSDSNLTIKFISRQSMKEMVGGYAGGYFDRINNKLYLVAEQSRPLFERIFMHELMHVLLHRYIGDYLIESKEDLAFRTDKKRLDPRVFQALSSIQDLFDKTKKLVSSDPNHKEVMRNISNMSRIEISNYISLNKEYRVYYGLTSDIHEFISELMSNVEFQKLLAGIEYDKHQSILDKIKEKISKLIRLIASSLGINIPHNSILYHSIGQMLNIVNVIEESYGIDSYQEPDNYPITIYTSGRLDSAIGTVGTFMSNFYMLENPIIESVPDEEDLYYSNSEGYYMSLRTKDMNIKRQISEMSHDGGNKARKARRLFDLDQDVNRRIQYMTIAVKAKFDENPNLQQELIDTGDAEIIEINTWGDTIFGVSAIKDDSGRYVNAGRNALGKILMDLRDHYKNLLDEPTGSPVIEELYAGKQVTIFREHPSYSYKQRTIQNVKNSDITLTIAANPKSLGEVATKNAALSNKKPFISHVIPLTDTGSIPSVSDLDVSLIDRMVSKINDLNIDNVIINIAGNGIHTFYTFNENNGNSGLRISQRDVDEYVYNLLKEIVNHSNSRFTITKIISGGQTGVDESGIKAASRLNIPNEVLAPRGWKFRVTGEDGNYVDISNEAKFKERFKSINDNSDQLNLFSYVDVNNVSPDSKHTVNVPPVIRKRIDLLLNSIEDVKRKLNQPTSPIEKAFLQSRLDELNNNRNFLVNELTAKALEHIADSQLSWAASLLNRRTSIEDIRLAQDLVKTWFYEVNVPLLSDEEKEEGALYREVFERIGTKARTIDNALFLLSKESLVTLANRYIDNPNFKFTIDHLENLREVSSIGSNLFDISRSSNEFIQWLGQIAQGATANQAPTLLRIQNEIIKKAKGVDMDKLKQKNNIGEYTFRLIDKYSDKYWSLRETALDDVHRTLHYYFTSVAPLPSREAAKQNAMYKFYNRMNEIEEVIDINLLLNSKKYKHPKFSSKQEYVDYLKKTYGEEEAKNLIDRAIEQVKIYLEESKEYKRIVSWGLADGSIAINPGETVDQALGRVTTEYQINYSPFRYLAERNGRGSVRYKNFEGHNYTTSVARKFDSNGNLTGFYDENFANLNEQELEFYNYATSLIAELSKFLPKNISDRIGHNFLAVVQKDIFETAREDGLLHSFKKLGNDLFNFLTTDEYINLESAELMKHGFTRSDPEEELSGMSAPIRYMSEKDLGVRELNKRREKAKMNLDRGIINEEAYNNIISDINIEYNRIRLKRSLDIPKLLEMFAAMAINYKFKTEVEDVVKVANRIVKEAALLVEDRPSASKKITNLINRDQEGHPNLDRQVEYALKAMITDSARSNESISNIRLYEGGVVKNIKNRNKANQIERERDRLDLALENKEIDQATYDSKMSELKLRYKQLGGKNLVWSSVGELLLHFQQLKGLAFNISAGIHNVTFGIIANLIHANGRLEFDNKSALRALNVIRKSRSKSKTKLAHAIKKFEILFEITEVKYGKNRERDSHLKKIDIKNLSVYEIQKRTEFMAQGHSLLASMMYKKLKDKDGNEVSLWEAYDDLMNWKTDLMGERSDWEDPLSALDTNEYTKFRDKVYQINKMIHGNYSPLSKMMIKRSVLGRALMMFKTWLPESVAARLQDERFDIQLERVVKGRYRSVVDVWRQYGFMAIPSAFAQAAMGKDKMIFNGNGTLSAIDEANMRMNFAELSYYIGISALVVALKALLDGDKDEEEKYITYPARVILNSLYRVEEDIAFYLTPGSIVNLNYNAIPMVKVYSDFSKAYRNTVKYVTEDDYKGQHPVTQWSKAFPVTNQISKIIWLSENVQEDPIRR